MSVIDQTITPDQERRIVEIVGHGDHHPGSVRTQKLSNDVTIHVFDLDGERWRIVYRKAGKTTNGHRRPALVRTVLRRMPLGGAS